MQSFKDYSSTGIILTTELQGLPFYRDNIDYRASMTTALQTGTILTAELQGLSFTDRDDIDYSRTTALQGKY